ncbi:unnamed protein product [Haemonchus placei]|uniref:Sld7_C domain-containing protein n=1 Tax=Haemonchus placei TaxID=6290 RepID=A0A0N4W3F8_HAEPC|nr:unnamed protein product [Haemonchus placei]
MQMAVCNNVGRTSIQHRSSLTRLHLDHELYEVRSNLFPNQPCSQNAEEAYESIRLFGENAADGCWSIQIDPQESASEPKLSKIIHPQLVTSHTPPFAMQLESSLLEDIRKRKNIIVQNAIERGRSMIQAQRKGALRKKRLLMKDSTTEEFSQRATETAIVSYYNELYRSAITEHALSQLRLRISPSPYSISAEQLALAKPTNVPLLTALLNGIKRGASIPEGLATAQYGNFCSKRDIPITETTSSRIPKKLLLTLNHIHVLKQIPDNSAECNFPENFALVDYKRALDSLEWSAVRTVQN